MKEQRLEEQPLSCVIASIVCDRCCGQYLSNWEYQGPTLNVKITILKSKVAAQLVFDLLTSFCSSQKIKRKLNINNYSMCGLKMIESIPFHKAQTLAGLKGI